MKKSPLSVFKKEVYISINIVVKDEEKADMVTSFLFCFDQIFSFLFKIYLFSKGVKEFVSFVSYRIRVGIRIAEVLGSSVKYGLS